jgi:hypothetical protein
MSRDRSHSPSRNSHSRQGCIWNALRSVSLRGCTWRIRAGMISAGTCTFNAFVCQALHSGREATVDNGVMALLGILQRLWSDKSRCQGEPDLAVRDYEMLHLGFNLDS